MAARRPESLDDLIDQLDARLASAERLSGAAAERILQIVLFRAFGPVPDHVAAELASALRVAGGTADDVSRAIAGEPKLLTARDVLDDARLEGEAARWVLDEPVLDATEASKLLGSRARKNARQHANKLRQQGSLLGVPHGNGYLYPAFQIDARRRRIHPAVEQVNAALDAARDPWGVASWWVTPKERLGGRRPCDLVGGDDESSLLPLAEAETAPIG